MGARRTEEESVRVYSQAVQDVSRQCLEDLATLALPNRSTSEGLEREWVRLSRRHGAFAAQIRGLRSAMVNATGLFAQNPALFDEAREHFEKVDDNGSLGFLSFLLVGRTRGNQADFATEAGNMLSVLGKDVKNITINQVVEGVLEGGLQPVRRIRRRRG